VEPDAEARSARCLSARPQSHDLRSDVHSAGRNDSGIFIAAIHLVRCLRRGEYRVHSDDGGARVGKKVRRKLLGVQAESECAKMDSEGAGEIDSVSLLVAELILVESGTIVVVWLEEKTSLESPLITA
jgi:hypothetical protein